MQIHDLTQQNYRVGESILLWKKVQVGGSGLFKKKWFRKKQKGRDESQTT